MPLREWRVGTESELRKENVTLNGSKNPDVRSTAVFVPPFLAGYLLRGLVPRQKRNYNLLARITLRQFFVSTSEVSSREMIGALQT